MAMASRSGAIKLFLCGDVMTGRGIDQILPYPSNPVLYESYVKDARGYVDLAEEVNGVIPKPVDFGYIWGNSLAEIAAQAPDARIINLETSITTSDDYWVGKGINYRMNPRNVPCLQAARIDVCCLANNHVLDWGYQGLLETITTLKMAGMKTSGAGRNAEEARLPAIQDLPGRGRVLVFAFGDESSGVMPGWSASESHPGIAELQDFCAETVNAIGKEIRKVKQSGDIAVVSIHWGGNWGYGVPEEHIRFAHHLIDEANVDILHGHSSHHAIGIDVYRGKLILYGCGDLINDYEGIGGYKEFRSDLGILYFPIIDPLMGRLTGLRLVVMTCKRFRLERAARKDVCWIEGMLNREGRIFGTAVKLEEDLSLSLVW
ncbi:poly-gamma-glutamate synthesis protein (capsule biosynthesis protein) [Syntrophus gentianae]|uniref:Poly-gamma-glutamate synthesis protein (Capsule biosynthesis protein) n=2 Tax=Syntrophus gentianae TaxID=43775 RepID=A0A1H8A0A9_9BACT|nr:poly-gamma-glutamate synthesis protein (capsule biosynthesis protein) [Syntrophus gentianae]